MATLSDRLTLAAFNAATEGRGNTKLVWGTYTGTGEWGEEHPTIITFEGIPLWVHIHEVNAPSGNEFAPFVDGMKTTDVLVYEGSDTLYLSWTDNSLQLYSRFNSGIQFNGNGRKYRYVALLGM